VWSPLRASIDHRSSIFSLEGGLDGLPLRVSHQKAKVKVEVEGRKDAEADWSMLSLSLNLDLLLW